MNMDVEIGWPHAAGPNPTITDNRKATPDAQDDALKSIHDALDGNRNTIYLTAFDEMWKAKQEEVDPLKAEKVCAPFVAPWCGSEIADGWIWGGDSFGE
jgi:hypothetical protein